MDQPNIVLQLVKAICRQDAVTTARGLAEELAPQFPDVPTAYIRLLAARQLALFYDPLTLEDLKAAKLKPLEEVDICEYLAETCRAEADKLRADWRPPPQ